MRGTRRYEDTRCFLATLANLLTAHASSGKGAHGERGDLIDDVGL